MPDILPVPKVLRILAFGLACVSCTALAAETPRLGELLSADEIETMSFTVLPNGDGLPEGSGSAMEGEGIYQRQCLACHGKLGEGGSNDRLSGGQGTLTSAHPVKTVGSYWPYATTIFDYIRRAMPYTAPGNLGNDEIYAVTGYLLYINGVVAKNKTIDARSLPAIEMPNREMFYWNKESME